MLHIWESEPLTRTVTRQRSKHSDRVCNSSKGDVEVVAYTKFRLVSIMVITADCLSAYESSILSRVAKLFQSSTAVVQLTVNQLVVGSIPTFGASVIALLVYWYYSCFVLRRS